MDKGSSVTVTLTQLARVGLTIEQHTTDPHADEWFVNQTMGPYTSTEAALLAGIQWIYGLYEDYKRLWDGQDATGQRQLVGGQDDTTTQKVGGQPWP